MKTKRIPNNLLGTCSFCKKTKTNRQIVGHPFGGRTACSVCFDVLKRNEIIEDSDMSLGEEQAYRMYGIL